MQKYITLSLEDKLVFLSRDNFNKVNFVRIGDAVCVVYPFYLIFVGKVKLKIRPGGGENIGRLLAGKKGKLSKKEKH